MLALGSRSPGQRGGGDDHDGDGDNDDDDDDGDNDDDHLLLCVLFIISPRSNTQPGEIH